MSVLTVQSDGGPYEVQVRSGALGDLGEACRSVLDTRRVLVVADDAVTSTHARTAIDTLQSAQFEPALVSIRAAEVRKCVEVVEQLWQAALDAGIGRTDAVIAVGGGITGDIAGFAAATWLRGVDLVQVPTTLLSMVDASVGGKTGVNVPLPESVGGGLGKNLIGAFWPPRLVLADPDTLSTLPSREVRCGLAEVVKHGLLADPQLLTMAREDGPRMIEGDFARAEAMIARAVAVKAEIVAADEREHGSRALLNLGHTFAHAVEGRPALDLHHGEAVAIGLVAAGHLGVSMGEYDASSLEDLITLLQAVGLPVELPGPASGAQLIERMRFDKKMAQGTMRLIVPCASTGASIRDDVADELVLEAWRRVGAS